MSARLNKKRKGRGNQIIRERTVTTLTEGSEGSFMTADEPQINITSSPFSVASSSAGPPSTISPSFSMSSGFPGFSYGYVPGTVIPPATFSQSAQPAHFYSAQSLPPGQSDLEILERLKETIKNNQHELFAPIPRPTALASVYLGPHSVSHVPPHPEQIPHDYPPNSQNGRHARASSTASSNDARRVVTGTSSSQMGNQKPVLPSGLSLDSIDSNNKTMDMDPPGLNTSLGVADGSQRTPRLEHASVAPAAKYDTRGINRSGTEKSLGEVSPSKAAADVKEEPRRDRDSDWSHRGTVASQDDTKPSSDRYSANGRATGDTRYSSDNSRPPPRYQRGDYDREKSRERDRNRDWDRDRDHRRYEPNNRFNDRRNDDRFRSTDNRRPPPEQRHYEPRYDSRSNDPLRRWDSKSSVESTTSPAARHSDTRSADIRPSRPLAEERSFDSRDGRAPVEDRPSDSRVSRPIGQERSFDNRGPRPLSTERPLDQRGPRPPLNDRPPPPSADDDRTGRSTVADDRRSYPPSSSDRHSRPNDAPRAPFSSPSKPTVDDRRPVNSSFATRPPEPRAPADDRRAPLSQAPSSSSIGGADRRPPPPAFSDRQRPSDSVPSSDRSARGSNDYPQRQRSSSIAEKGARISSPVRPPPSHNDRGAPPPRSQVPLEDRISRPASLQERLGGRPSDAPPSARSEDKGGRPPPPSEQRPTTSAHDDRKINSEQPSNGKVAIDTAGNNGPPINVRTGVPDTSRPPPAVSRDPPRPPAQAVPPARRSTGPPPQRLSYPGNPPAASAPEDTFKPRGAPVSPRRAEYRPLDRATYPDRYERDASRERRPDPIDVDAPPRYADRAAPQSYTRPSPPPFSRPDERDWPPAREHSYTRHPHDPPAVPATYERDWRGDERAAYDSWEQRNKWDRERPSESEFARDPRYFSRDTAATWDAREPRERYPPEEPPATRAYESRLVPRGADAYADGRTYDRPRYPETSSPVGAPPRVRPRSPSPVRRAGIDDLQPPLKRPRDDAYTSAYYAPPPPSRDIPRDYPPPPSSIYYDDIPPTAGPAGPSGERRDRAYRERDYPPYDARHAPAYARDDRRYG